MQGRRAGTLARTRVEWGSSAARRRHHHIIMSEADEERKEGNEEAEKASVWKRRRRRRRERQKIQREAEAVHHVKGDTKHWAVTADRHRREAIRTELRKAMMAPWSDGGEGGLRVVIDCGMQELMNDAELKSLATQLQCSYAGVLSLTTAAVVERCDERIQDDDDDDDAEVGGSNPGGPGPDVVTTGKTTTEEETEEEREKDKEANNYNNNGGAAAAIPPEKKTTTMTMTARERKAAAAVRDIAAAGDACRPARLMFSSLDGRLSDTLRRDEGSARWPVTVSPDPFTVAALRAATTTAPSVVTTDSVSNNENNNNSSSSGSGSDGTSSACGAEDAEYSTRRRPRIIVMSPDAPEAIVDAPCRDDIFVVGGLCDYKRVTNATLDRAEAAGVEARRLPIEEIMGPVSVNILTVNQTVEALCRADLSGGDWKAALEAVLPARKLEEMAATLKKKNKKMKNNIKNESESEGESERRTEEKVTTGTGIRREVATTVR